MDGSIQTQCTVVSTFASPHEPTLEPKARKRASVSPAQITAFGGGFRIANPQKNKINLCFVGRFVQVNREGFLTSKQLIAR